MADLEAVVEAAGVRDDPVLFGTHNGGAVAALYASRHRVRQLVLCNAWARLERCDDFPIGLPSQILDVMAERYRSEWGGGEISNFYASERIVGSRGKVELASTSHNQLDHLFHLNRTYDIRHALPSITAPTLIIHLASNQSVPADHGRYLAASIPGARLALLPGADDNFLTEPRSPCHRRGRTLHHGPRHPVHRPPAHHHALHGHRRLDAPGRIDGRRALESLIEDHNDRMHQHAAAHGGHEVKHTGDGFLVAFDDADSAVRCALATMAAVAKLGLVLRAGIHVGEVARMGKNDFSGIAVHFAQRLCARAEGGQLLTSADVRRAARTQRLPSKDVAWSRSRASRESGRSSRPTSERRVGSAQALQSRCAWPETSSVVRSVPPGQAVRARGAPAGEAVSSDVDRGLYVGIAQSGGHGNEHLSRELWHRGQHTVELTLAEHE